MHPHASRVAAEAAAVDGLQSSPDTQECREIFRDLMGVEFDSADFEPTINSPLTTDEQSPLVPLDDFIFKKPELPAHVSRAVLATAHGRLSQDEDPSQSNNGHKHLTTIECRQQSQTGEVVDKASAQVTKWTSRRDSRGRLRYHLSDGTQVHPNPRSSSMEDILSPLYSSDGSNLSKTQENDPAVYERFRADAASANLPYPSSTRSLNTQDAALGLETGTTAADTTRSYAPDDTGHLTLDYKPPLLTPMHDSFDETQIDDTSHIPLISKDAYMAEDDPQTPSQPKPNLGRPGTVMRLSQMFAQTQPSSGLRDPQRISSSSSRPSPDLFRHQQTPKNIVSSPLFQRGGKAQDANIIAFDAISSSSPPNSPVNLNINQLDTDHLPRSDGRLISPNREHVPFGPTSSIPKFPQPYEMYIPRKESQERRMRQAAINDGSQFSDDDFSDGEMERNRRAKLKKKQAAMALAAVGTSRPGSSGNDIVEVPSTSNGRRRSQAEVYVAHCSGLDTKDFEEDGTVADSQSVPATNLSQVLKTSSQGRLKRLDKLGSNRSRSCSGVPGELTALSDGIDLESSGQLPGLVQNEDSDATESDREDSPAPMPGQITQPLTEVSSNVADLRTPAPTKKILAIDGVTMIPETSPSEPHLHKYGEIVSQTPPPVSTEDGDDAFNLFTQDAEFNQIMSPSPQRMSCRTTGVKANSNISPAQDSTPPLEKSGSEGNGSSLAGPTSTRLGFHRMDDAATSKPDSTAPENESEYVTAPTDIPIEFDTGDNLDSTEVVGQRRIRAYISMQRPRWSPISSPLSSVPQQDGIGLDKNAPASLAGVVAKIPEIRNNRGRSDNKSRRSHRLNKSFASQTEDHSTVGLSDDLDEATGENFEVASNRLRSIDQSTDSSKALRRVAAGSNGVSHMKKSQNVTPVSKVKKATRSSGRDKEMSKSDVMEEPITPVLPTRRKATTNKPAKTGIFAEMAFSVSYGNRDDEKERIIRLIRQNGGRVLDKGFDELFDMSASETSIFTKSSEDKDDAGEKNLVLVVEASRTTFTCLIADVHSRRAKFMQALALGLPCLSGRWIEHCVAHGSLLDWDIYLLAAGESSYLGGAVRNRNLQPYPAATAKLSECIERRQKLLTGKSILIVMGRGRAEERKKAYLFLTHALGARSVRRTQTNLEARKILLEAENNGDEYDWVYVDDDERDAERIIFGTPAPSAARKRKRSTSTEGNEDQYLPPKKIKVISDEFVIQSLILGKLIEED